VENLAPHRDSIPDRPARSESLYRLSYPGPRHYGLGEMMVVEARWAFSSEAQPEGREVDLSPASNAEFKNKGTVPSLPLTPS
jgi:hypothetical protein